MSRQFACAALWLVLFATPVVAQSTDVQLGDGEGCAQRPPYLRHRWWLTHPR